MNEKAILEKLQRLEANHQALTVFMLSEIAQVHAGQRAILDLLGRLLAGGTMDKETFEDMCPKVLRLYADEENHRLTKQLDALLATVRGRLLDSLSNPPDE